MVCFNNHRTTIPGLLSELGCPIEQTVLGGRLDDEQVAIGTDPIQGHDDPVAENRYVAVLRGQ